MNLDPLLRLLIFHIVGGLISGSTMRGLQRLRMNAGVYGVGTQGLIHGLLAVCAVGWVWWQLALLIAVVHSGLQYLRSGAKDTSIATWRLPAEQSLHLLVMLFVWWWITGYDFIAVSRRLWEDVPTLAAILAALILTCPVGVLIRMFTSRWSKDLRGTEPIDRSPDQDLEDAGMWIGMIERLLILVFVLHGVLEAVGYLLAAKSVFRFGDLKDGHDRKRTEYVVMGTFLSFGIAVVVALLARALRNP